MTIDKATLVNQALTDPLGVGPIFSIDDDGDLAESVAAIWPVVVDRVFGLHDWSWSQITRRNIRRAETPDNGWQYAFDLPGDRIGSPLKYLTDPRSRAPLRDFALEGGILYCDYPDTWSRCKFYVDPDIWPPEWRGGFVLALGGYLASPVWQDMQLRADILQECFGTASQGGAGGVFGRLIAQDKASQPVGSPMQQDDPVTNARYEHGNDHWAGRFR